MMKDDELLYALIDAISDNAEDQMASLLVRLASQAQVPSLLQRGLVLAAILGSPEAIEVFLDLGAAVNGLTQLSAQCYDEEGPYTTHYEQYALLAALKEAHVEAVAVLLSHGADVTVTDCLSGDGVLHIALCHAAYPQLTLLVALLLSHGASISACDAAGDTVLHRAVERGCLPAVKLLLQRGSDPRAQNEAGKTPLEIATRYDAPTLLGRRRARIARYLRHC
ncbi:MAG: ankyrin repeat domain-containing protein [Bacteroidota bacterium]